MQFVEFSLPPALIFVVDLSAAQALPLAARSPSFYLLPSRSISLFVLLPCALPAELILESDVNQTQSLVSTVVGHIPFVFRRRDRSRPRHHRLARAVMLRRLVMPAFAGVRYYRPIPPVQFAGFCE
jgi:hypothetical protein